MDVMTFSNDDLLLLSTFVCSDSTGMHSDGATLTTGRVAREMIGTIETKRGDGELHIIFCKMTSDINRQKKLLQIATVSTKGVVRFT